MKITRLTMLILILLLASSVSYARYTPRYFMALYGGYTLVQGDMDGEGELEGQNPEGGTETTYIPEIPAFAEYRLQIGSEIGSHTISVLLNIQPWGTMHWQDDRGRAQSGDADRLLFAFEYRYRFLAPGILEPFTGIGYNFSSLDGENMSERTNGNPQDVKYSATGPHLITGLIWRINDYIAPIAEMSWRYMPWRNVATEELGFSELSESITYHELNFSLGLQARF